MPRPRLPHLIALALLCLPASNRADPTPPPDPTPVTADIIYTDAFRLLATGDQKGAEAVLAEAVRHFPADPRLAFFHAACPRTRFDIRAAAPRLVHVIDLDKDSPYAHAAAHILRADLYRDQKSVAEKSFAALAQVVAAHPDDPLLTWMAAVQCRALRKTPEGLAYFAALKKHFDPHPGPALYHQTYANLLDDARKHLDALHHRQLAVKLEPAPWSYDGLANTLSSLKRWPQADMAHSAATTLAPHHAQYWHNWSITSRRRGDWTAVADQCAKGLAADPTHIKLWNEWGDAHAHLNNLPESLRCYARAIDLAPEAYYAYERSAAVLDQLNQPAQAQVFRTRAAALNSPPKPTTAPHTTTADTR